ncbi:MAG TPA: hypothetical protein VK841_20920 [Polyangiaceae bacterium]|jgi:hypothetical protein|nr:hypothetical protein [Polyangiaceae bacterium]
MTSRPSFAKDFPRTPEVDTLVDDFARGDYARVRAQAPRLAQSADDPEVQRAARTLVQRTNPDPLALLLLGLAALLLVALAGFWIANGRPPPAETPATQTR